MAAILMLIIIDSAYISNALAQTNATDIGTKRIIATQKTTASGENVTNLGNNLTQTNTNATDIGNNLTQTNTNATDIGNNLTQTNTTDIGTKRIIATQKTTASGQNATDVGYNQIMPNRIINNVGDVAVDKFSTIFIADDSGNKSYSKV